MASSGQHGLDNADSDNGSGFILVQWKTLKNINCLNIW